MHVVRENFPLVTAYREALLDSALSPTVRLLYATLAANLGTEDNDLGHIARLLRIEPAGGLEPFIDELSAAGIVDYLDHEGPDTSSRSA